MGKETIRDEKWFPEYIMKDLIDIGGLSAKSLGYDVLDRSGRRFFYDKAPFAIVGWKSDDYLMLAFPKDFPPDTAELIVKSFIKVVDYKPFVKYDIFQRNEEFFVFEWTKMNADKKMSEILATPGAKHIEDVSERY